jgi:hypothetical protein
MLGEDPATYRQLDKQGSTKLAYLSAIKDKEVMDKILLGEELIKTKVVKPGKREDINAVARDYLGNVGEAYEMENYSVTIENAIQHLAATAVNPEEPTAGEIKSSLKAVTGGVVEINGTKVEKPRDVDEDDFEYYFDFLNKNDIKEHGGLSSKYAEDIPLSRVVPKFESPGKYLLEYKGQYLLNANDEPLIIPIDNVEITRKRNDKGYRNRQQRRSN